MTKNVHNLEPHLVQNIPLHNALRPKHLQFITRKQTLNYFQKAEMSEGFDVDDCPGFLEGKIVPIRKQSHEWKVAEEIAVFAAADNAEKTGKPMMTSLIKANYQAVGGIMYYLTFEGKTCGSKIATYQSKVWLKPKNPVDLEVLLFRMIDGSETSASSRSTSISGFFEFVRDIRQKSRRLLTFAEARKIASQHWQTQLSKEEKDKYIWAAELKNNEALAQEEECESE